MGCGDAKAKYTQNQNNTFNSRWYLFISKPCDWGHIGVAALITRTTCIHMLLLGTLAKVNRISHLFILVHQ